MGITTEATKARLASITKLYRPRMTASDIAVALSRIEQKRVTRNVVIGLYTRYGKDQLKACPLQAPKRVLTPRKPKGDDNVVPFVLPESAFTYAPAHPTKRMIDLEAHECRWPMSGDAFDTQFCSQEADGSYCDHHRLMSVGRGTRLERMAARALRKMA